MIEYTLPNGNIKDKQITLLGLALIFNIIGHFVAKELLLKISVVLAFVGFILSLYFIVRVWITMNKNGELKFRFKDIFQWIIIPSAFLTYTYSVLERVISSI